jgi:hypothetical protein
LGSVKVPLYLVVVYHQFEVPPKVAQASHLTVGGKISGSLDGMMTEAPGTGSVPFGAKTVPVMVTSSDAEQLGLGSPWYPLS